MQDRYKVIPRTLIFLFNNAEVLLIKHNSKNKIGFGKWNGIGGHIEEDEDPFQAAFRETREETGLEILKLNLEFITIIPETSTYGICLFIFSGHSRIKKIVESSEGQLMWIKIDELNTYPLMDDLQMIMNLILKRKPMSPTKILSYVNGKKGVLIQEVG